MEPSHIAVADLSANVPTCDALQPYRRRAFQTVPRWDRLSACQRVSMDIEFQNYKKDPAIWADAKVKGKKVKHQHRIGHVTVINEHGEVVLDVFGAYPVEAGIEVSLPPPEFGVDWEDLKVENGAVPGDILEMWLEQIFTNRTVILHGGTGDRKAFYYRKDLLADDNPNGTSIIDTQDLYWWLMPCHGTPGLARCASIILGKSIQEVGHCPVEDAKTTMELYLRHPLGMC
ncbi:hypothetical protein PRZ48_015258 [Zasmidium cellare]|uniref:Exonuclease domain-containing protein n=1 Tax=Zasmidium cellare TaxID=395010 RepID=A0ABR0DWJ5_ZASCE|nr:hypothetical protein PRZ48_015258 [Zasmidium cellare]